MAKSRQRQGALPGSEGLRDDELEDAGCDLVRAGEAKVAAKDSYDAAYASVKQIMRAKGIDEYPMLDAPGVTLVRKAKDEEIKVVGKPTAAMAQQTHDKPADEDPAE